MSESIIADYILGPRTSRLFQYFCQNSRKKIYQARIAQDLDWTLSTTQYHLEWFVKMGVLDKSCDAYRTYYQLDHQAKITKFLKYIFKK